jgi:hypothetical protein
MCRSPSGIVVQGNLEWDGNLELDLYLLEVLNALSRCLDLGERHMKSLREFMRY